MPRPVRVLFVCSGNICRSPTAEVVLRQRITEAGLGERVEVDSAGTGGWHAGDDMDRRSRETLAAAGYPAQRHVARQFTIDDFDHQDVVVALDHGHRNDLWDLADETDDPAAARAKIVMLRAHDPEALDDDTDVADPYYGGPGGFTDVLTQIERSCGPLLQAITAAEPV